MHRIRKVVKRLPFVFVLTAIFLYVAGPFLWILNGSFQRRVELFSRPPTWLPSSLYLDNYIDILNDPTYIASLKNSLILATATTLITLVLGSLAGYAFARLPVPLKRSLFLVILVTQMLPAVSLLIPFYLLMRKLGLAYTHYGLVIAFLPFSLPTAIWLLRSFFSSIPEEIEDAARVDGCTRVEAMFRVILPLATPGFISTGIVVFVGALHQYMIPLVMGNDKTKPFTVKLAQYIGEESTNYEAMFPAACMFMLLLILFLTPFHKYITEGIAEGGVKR